MFRLKICFATAVFAGIISIGPSRSAANAGQLSVDSASPQAVVDGMANKFVRGFANIATGWLELPKQIYLTSTDEGVTKGIFVGPLKGIAMTVVRTVVGGCEVATFFAPQPGFYDPYFDPAYVWQPE